MQEALVDAAIILDDDPTGPQALSGVRVLLTWSPERVAAALAGRRAVHLVTNVRALPPERVQRVVASAARAGMDGAPKAHLLLRGDSTLRGHLREELEGLREAGAWSSRQPVLLVPTLPAAGRVTVDGVHLLERDGVRVALHETEYACDGPLAYGDARLLTWADERSGGLLPERNGRELQLDDLRRNGPARVADVIAELTEAGRPAALAPDAETVEDLRMIAEGYASAWASGHHALLRCAPAFVGVLTGTTAPGLVPAPRADDGLLVVCGSYVPTSTRQLGLLLDAYPGSLVEVDVLALASDRHPRGETERAARRVSELLERNGFAVVATPRERPPGTLTLESGERIALGLAAVVAALTRAPRVVVAKGGITSHVTLEAGLGADEAEVVGPVLPGVSHWRVEGLRGSTDYLVVPGNVGADDLLVALVGRMLPGPPSC